MLVVTVELANAQARRTAATRTALLDAARAVLDERGYQQATVARIAATAGRAHGTFYLHFTNKEDIYRCLVQDMWQQLRAQSKVVWRRSEPMRSMAATVHRYVEAYGQNVALWRLLDDMAATNPAFAAVRAELRHEFVAVIRRGIEGSLRHGDLDGLSPGIVAELLAGMLDDICAAQYLRGRYWDFDELVHTVTVAWARVVGYQ